MAPGDLRGVALKSVPPASRGLTAWSPQPLWTSRKHAAWSPKSLLDPRGLATWPQSSLAFKVKSGGLSAWIPEGWCLGLPAPDPPPLPRIRTVVVRKLGLRDSVQHEVVDDGGGEGSAQRPHPVHLQHTTRRAAVCVCVCVCVCVSLSFCLSLSLFLLSLSLSVSLPFLSDLYISLVPSLCLSPFPLSVSLTSLSVSLSLTLPSVSFISFLFFSSLLFSSLCLFLYLFLCLSFSVGRSPAAQFRLQVFLVFNMFRA